MKWSEIVERYDHADDGMKKHKQAKSQRSIVVLILLYLAMGKDYPSSIADAFYKYKKKDSKREQVELKESSFELVNLPGFGILTSPSKLSALLLQMNKDRLILEDDEKIYKLNRRIVIDLLIDDANYNHSGYTKPNEGELANLVEEFFNYLDNKFNWVEELKREGINIKRKTKNHKENARKINQKKLKKIESFKPFSNYDYYDFINFLINESVCWKSDSESKIDLSHLLCYSKPQVRRESELIDILNRTNSDYISGKRSEERNRPLGPNWRSVELPLFSNDDSQAK